MILSLFVTPLIHLSSLISFIPSLRSWPFVVHVCTLHQCWPCHCSLHVPFQLHGHHSIKQPSTTLFQFPRVVHTQCLISIYIHTSVILHHSTQVHLVVHLSILPQSLSIYPVRLCRPALHPLYLSSTNYHSHSSYSRAFLRDVMHSVVSTSLPPQTTTLSAKCILSLGVCHLIRVHRIVKSIKSNKNVESCIINWRTMMPFQTSDLFCWVLRHTL